MHRGLFSLIIFFILTNLALAKNEDKILQALIYEEYGQFQQACDIYTSLFKESNESVYLQKALFLALSVDLKQKDELLKASKDFLEYTAIARLNALYFFEIGDYKQAEAILYELIKKEQDYRNYEILGDIFAKKALYTKALEQYNLAYKLFEHENLLLKIVEINIKNKNINQAKKSLEEFVKNSQCTLKTCTLLLKIYQEQNDNKASINTLKKLYTLNNDIKYIYAIIELLIQQKDYEQALKITQDYNIDTDTKIFLYTQTKNYKKAYDLALKHYELSKNKKYLAMAGILEFEIYTNPKSKRIDDKQRLISILNKFEQSVDIRSDALYQNYYGYALIDYDIDIAKGIELVNWALEQEPDNLYYLDSLAWGYYKLKDCKKAYEILQKTLHDKEFSNSDESKTHLKAIKKCLKK
ncbi:ATP-dependent nuclease subunit B [Campylobacter peloridis]|uniref:ATP-dependent nuclease subunit B n=1 Tax=Campylobacter peloridis TaxID=488546 RepID=A0A5C7DLD0_9BACT|nr:ATP-dependent nuclease subunit B [Campylobacter peloridis]TXE78131.1 ATP-dependent nuclease subunit B [Campylobacter peloridis]